MTAPGQGEPGLVSCIIGSFNSERYLAAAIDSALMQTQRPFEVIVVDSESTDGSVALSRSYGPPVRVIEVCDVSPAATRNAGLLASRGEYVAWLDDDDLWHPHKLDMQLARFRARPELECSVTLVENFWDEGYEDEAAHYRAHRRMEPVAGYVMPTTLAKRAVFGRVGLLDESLFFSDAADWFIRAEEHGIVVELLSEVLAFHRLHGTNLTRRRVEESTDEIARVLKRRLDRRRQPSV